MSHSATRKDQMAGIQDDLQRLRQRADALQGLMRELENATPSRSEGTDTSGAVRAVLGPDGLPEAIRVHASWQEKIAAQSFAAAVVDACQQAMRNRGAAWTETLEHNSWQERVNQLSEAQSEPFRSASAAFSAAPEPGLDTPPPRGLDDLAEEAISLLDEVASGMRPAAQPLQATAANSRRTLILELSPGGRVSCSVDARWAADRSGAQLTQELIAVLAEARQQLKDRTGQQAARTGDLAAQANRLFTDSLAFINRSARTNIRNTVQDE